MLHRLLRGPVLAAWPIVVLLAWSATARAGEDYFMLMFGSQRTPNDPNYAHTFATFVRVSWPGDAPCPTEGAQVEAHTISWLAATGVIRVMRPHPECGRNFGLHETIEWCLRDHMRVSVWGAYRIEPVLYGRALRQIALLESGQVRYKANDAGYRNNRVSNCIHAVSVLSEGYRLRVGSPGYGEMASYFVLQELEALDHPAVHPLQLGRLGARPGPVSPHLP